MNIRGKTILLTGATGGIGQAIAHRLISEGAVLIVVGRSAKALQELAGELDLYLTKGFLLEADIATHAGREKIRTALLALPQPVDVLINCAGVSLFGLLPDNQPAAIEKLIAINITATILLTRSVLPYLHPHTGRIINVGSSFGGLGYPGFTVYCATKFAIRGFSEALRRELNSGDPRCGNVQVAYLAPRATNTRINSSAICAMNRELGNAMDEPEVVAFAVEKMLSATRMFDRNIGWPERLFLRINSVFPGVIDRALRKQLPTIRHYASLNIQDGAAALAAKTPTQPTHL